MRDDLTIRLLRDRYLAVAKAREAVGGGPWFPARMMGRRALVVEGEDGARLFYDTSLVTRSGAVPAPVRLLLFGPGAVHGLNGDEHASRKRLFLDIVDRPAVERLAAEVADRLEVAASRWSQQGTVTLFDELTQVYGSAVIAWAGLDLDARRTARLSRELAAMVDSFGLGGTSFARGYLARIRANRWARAVVEEVRDGRRTAPDGSVLAKVAARDDLNHTVAGVELLNVLRPTVAVAYFGSYAAHALAQHPDVRERLAAGSAEHLRAFEHEIRRWYPFVPLLTGRLARDHTWRGHRFPRRSWIVLDVLGTNVDPAHWTGGRSFDPERFLGREPSAFEYVPHGGGDPASGHRCPGEPLAVGILEATLKVLAGLDYEIAPGDDTVPMGRIPSLPPRRMQLQHVRTLDRFASSGD
jgi:fatty-acid peroxygenase